MSSLLVVSSISGDIARRRARQCRRKKMVTRLVRRFTNGFKAGSDVSINIGVRHKDQKNGIEAQGEGTDLPSRLRFLNTLFSANGQGGLFYPTHLSPSFCDQPKAMWQCSHKTSLLNKAGRETLQQMAMKKGMNRSAFTRAMSLPSNRIKCSYCHQ
ncbi:MAG: hypothetical protein U0T81_10345 [Saprospiraceae bacterium]